MLGLSLKIRGHEVNIATCDGIFRDCEVLHWDPPSTKRLGCQTCRNTGAEFFKIFNHTPIPASSLLNLEDGNLADEWLKSIENSDYTQVKFKDYNLGEWSTSSVITCFKAAISELNRPDIRALHYTYLRSSFLVVMLFERMIAKFKPDRIICFNGRMYPYRVAMEVAARHGIDVLVHERGNSDDRFNFALNTRTYDSNHVIKFATKWMDTPLKPSEVSRIIEHYNARELGKDSNLPGFHKKKGDPELLRRRLNIPNDVNLTGFFSSSEFELNKFDGFTTKYSQLEVLRAVTDAFRSRTDYLVVRHHPFLIGSKENPPNSAFISELMKIADSSPPNVRVIMPQDEINTYDILPHLKGCIAPWSSVAIESTFRGVASAVLEESYLNPAAFKKIEDISPRAIEELLNELHSATERCDLDLIRRCFRFGYTYIGRMDIQFNSFGISNTYEPIVKISSAEDLLPGRDPALDRIIDHLTLGTELHAGPTDFTSQDLAIESELLLARRREILEQRKIFQPKPPTTQPKVAVIALIDLSESMLYKQRHKNTAIYHLKDAELGDQSNLVKQLQCAISKIDADFVHIAAANARYDENFITAGIETLSSAKKDKVLCGAWIMDNNREICGELLSRRFSPDKPSNCQQFANIDNTVIAEFLTQFIFTKDGIDKILNACTKEKSIVSWLVSDLKGSSTAILPGPTVGLSLRQQS